MLPVKQKIKTAEAEFLQPVQDRKGHWKVKVLRQNICVKMTYCINREHAEITRGQWIQDFWNWQLN